MAHSPATDDPTAPSAASPPDEVALLLALARRLGTVDSWEEALTAAATLLVEAGYAAGATAFQLAEGAGGSGEAEDEVAWSRHCGAPPAAAGERLAAACAAAEPRLLPLAERSGLLLPHSLPQPLAEAVAAQLALAAAAVAGRERARYAQALRDSAEAEARYFLFHDPLTELPNRVLFLDRLQHAIARAERGGGQVAVLLLNLDRFKSINDSFGHHIGDLLLQVVARRLAGCIRDGDSVARMWADEFAVVLEGLDGTAQAAPVARKILDTLAQPYQLEGCEVYVTASIGIALYPDDDRRVDELLRCADAAATLAKGEGRDHFRFYRPEKHGRALERLTLESCLRHALERDELELYYQPQVAAADGRPVGAEALLRWHHPEQGLVPPVRFIPLLEETGLIVPVGEWIVTAACRQAAAWAAAGRPLRIAVNLSARQFHGHDLVATVTRALAAAALPVALLELEITEGMLMHDGGGSREILAALKERGLTIALDDFGTGYSSLSYLRRFPIDVLKIDQCFVRELPTRRDDAALVAAIVAMARSLGMSVVAEGVEGPAHLERLRELGCDELQGYHFARPLPAAELERWLAAYRPADYGLAAPSGAAA